MIMCCAGEYRLGSALVEDFLSSLFLLSPTLRIIEAREGVFPKDFFPRTSSKAPCTMLRETGNPSAPASSSNSASNMEVWRFLVHAVPSDRRVFIGAVRPPQACSGALGNSCLETRDTCENFDAPSAFTAATRNSTAINRGGGSDTFGSEENGPLRRAAELFEGEPSPSVWRAAVIDAGHRDGARTRHSGSKWAWTSRQGVHLGACCCSLAFDDDCVENGLTLGSDARLLAGTSMLLAWQRLATEFGGKTSSRW
mmetsp:Transcript_21389/g.73838  ORF Transcript_21389/g.73838 Transcript_21389/m.73838 type:complete len:254 (+) Transcript_21389:309-1070(+)